MRMKLSRRIDAPPEKVFALATDIENWADRMDGIVKVEMLTDGPVGVGTRFKETRIMFKKEAVEEMEVSKFEPDTLFTLRGESCGSIFESTHTFRPVTFFARLMSPLCSLMAGSMRKCIEKDLDDLKSAAESGA